MLFLHGSTKITPPLMGNVVGGKVYTSSSEFTQMRVALKKKKKKELPFIGSLALFVWVTRLSLTKPPEESQPTNASSFVGGCLTARSILSFSIQCLCICMIASVETAKWKLCRKSTRLRPNPLSSLLDNISQVYPTRLPCTGGCHVFVPLCEHSHDWTWGASGLCSTVSLHIHRYKKFFKFCEHKDALKSPVNCLWTCLPGSRWSIAL